MRVLVVYCHPRADSYAAALRDAACSALAAGGHAVELADLYAENFRPVMDAAERGRYHDPAANMQGIEAEIARLKRAEAIVFVYPTWWYGMPAMLKGWFDRVWAPGIVFEINGGVIKPLLTDMRHVVAVTTMGAPWWFAWFMGHPGRMFLSRGVRAICAHGCRFTWRAHDRMDSSTPESRAAFLEKIRRTFESFQ
ncbi:MAG: NAD(P)H-dependent oxidoreductase [Proteobacteria bacterium]|nr:NAD(P)H-dependent oxidoreductase [Pseudomonadota bacterium]